MAKKSIRYTAASLSRVNEKERVNVAQKLNVDITGLKKEEAVKLMFESELNQDSTLELNSYSSEKAEQVQEEKPEVKEEVKAEEKKVEPEKKVVPKKDVKKEKPNEKPKFHRPSVKVNRMTFRKNQ